ncbi:MAG: hypothetical protein U0T75_10630 [Chitinophagales bacterium]
MKKKILHLLLCCAFIATAYAQAPESTNYQAVARNSGGNVLTNQAVGLRFTVHTGTAGGTVVYQETASATTNQFGLFTHDIGTGTVVQGTFNTIGWGTGAKFLQVDIDPAGGSSYTNMGTSQMMSVPYALYAKEAGNGVNLPLDTTISAAAAVLKLTNSMATGMTSGIYGAVASTSNGSGTQAGATGVMGEVISTTPGGYSAAVRGVNHGTAGLGIGVVGYQDGSGWGVYGETPSGIGVYGITTANTGTAVGVRGETYSTTGVGVVAKYSGTGVGTALEINNGGIKVSGTNKAAFVHTATVANKLSANGTDVDNVLCNGDPNCFLIVTQKLNPSGIVYNNSPIGVYYNTTRNKWEIFNENNVAIPTNAQFNVLVIKQ